MKQNLIWHKFISGDRVAFGLIFRTYYDDLYNYGLRFSKDREEVKDSLQELFLKLWKFRKNFSSVTDIKPYIFKMYRNLLLDNLKAGKKIYFKDAEGFKANISEFSAEDFIIKNQINKETRDKLALALKQLSPKQREVIYLRFYHEIPFVTIADIMDINVQSVRNNMSRAMVTLRKVF